MDLHQIAIGSGAVNQPADTSRVAIDKLLRRWCSSTMDSRLKVRCYNGEEPFVDVDIGDLVRDLAAERDTLKALCVEFADAYDLAIHVMFGTTVPAKQAELLTRARSILK